MSREQSRARASARQPFPSGFLARRLFSLAGIVPVGAFLVLHLWTYASALRGRQHFEEVMRRAAETPYSSFFEAALIYAPLLYHAAYGLKVGFEGRPNVARYAYSRNWTYTLQRVTGGLALAFIGYHLWHFRIPMLVGKMSADDVFPELCKTLSSTTATGLPYVAVLYLVGIAAAVFHLANGLWGFCCTWGFTVTRSSQRVLGAACGVLGLLLFFFGAHTLIYFATGSALPGMGDGTRRGGVVDCSELQKSPPVVAAAGVESWPTR